ncbi:MAG: polysaccharide deacetylase family protein [Mangrovibacterium sp.]
MQFADPRIRLPRFVTRWFPEALWRMPDTGKRVYLTFDDGPIPGLTPWLLGLLREEKLKACFFCVGENVQRHPQVYRSILEEGHLTGNHTFNHLHGLKTPSPVFLENVARAGEYIDSVFFRPPHGWMRRKQYLQLIRQYRVVMWDLVSCDYRQSAGPNEVAANVLKHVRPGSVITFHDSLKSERNLRQALPRVIRELKDRGYSFGSLDEPDGNAGSGGLD